MPNKYAHLRKVSIEQVIRVECNEGSGVIGEDDPVCSVISYFTMDGQLIGHNDWVPDRKLRAGTGGDA